MEGNFINVEQLKESEYENTVFAIPLNMDDIKSLSKWATFRAVIDIITGAITCLGIITAAIGIPQIIAGIKLLGATDELNRYISTRNNRKIAMALYNMSKYFKVSGAAIIVKICFSVIVLLFYGILISFLLSNTQDIIRNVPDFVF